jgi:hypothetical protein
MLFAAKMHEICRTLFVTNFEEKNTCRRNKLFCLMKEVAQLVISAPFYCVHPNVSNILVYESCSLSKPETQTSTGHFTIFLTGTIYILHTNVKRRDSATR